MNGFHGRCPAPPPPVRAVEAMQLRFEHDKAEISIPGSRARMTASRCGRPLTDWMGEDRELHRRISGSAARLQPERFAAQPQRGSLDGQWATQ